MNVYTSSPAYISPSSINFLPSWLLYFMGLVSKAGFCKKRNHCTNDSDLDNKVITNATLVFATAILISLSILSDYRNFRIFSTLIQFIDSLHFKEDIVAFVEVCVSPSCSAMLQFRSLNRNILIANRI